jgi:hypothetical protein
MIQLDKEFQISYGTSSFIILSKQPANEPFLEADKSGSCPHSLLVPGFPTNIFFFVFLVQCDFKLLSEFSCL